MGIDEIELGDHAFDLDEFGRVVVGCDPMMSKAGRAQSEER
jgi:hypothetical protein